MTTSYVSLPQIAGWLGVRYDSMQHAWYRYRDHEDPVLRFPSPDVRVGDMNGWSSSRVRAVEAWHRRRTGHARAGRPARQVETVRYLSLPEMAAAIGWDHRRLRETYERHVGDRQDAFPAPDVRVACRTRWGGGWSPGWSPHRVSAVRAWINETRVVAAGSRRGPRPRKRAAVS